MVEPSSLVLDVTVTPLSPSTLVVAAFIAACTSPTFTALFNVSPVALLILSAIALRSASVGAALSANVPPTPLFRLVIEPVVSGLPLLISMLLNATLSFVV
ncbi:hypothetical protein COK_1397 [Mannheimia haemolytica serotype A2 str. BOVINE]|nr:hypothetical protein COK_1397 [Mannheimia haemolytica serotype A2 str. BOVINE]